MFFFIKTKKIDIIKNFKKYIYNLNFLKIKFFFKINIRKLFILKIIIKT